jgi:hypothetical protein
VQANKQASIKSLGVALGRVCIARSIPVSVVADVFGVSRMTVYNWFKGDTLPHRALTDDVQSYINSHKKKD